jgi:hypothetical protein
MNQPNNIKVKPAKELGFNSGKKENVFLVHNISPAVKPGDTVEFLIEGDLGYTVYFPYGEHFNAQVFEAIKNPHWAAGEIAELRNGNTSLNYWGVQMTRISVECHLEDKVLPFCIFSKKFQTFAVGNSPPKMTLDP